MKVWYLMVIKKNIYHLCEGEREKSVAHDHRLPSLYTPCDAKW